MHAIPTRYAGVEFRSRLEARWAAFFDLLRWPWEYEPIDLAGYIPDFVLTFHRPLLVEVKPALSYDELYAACPKVRESGWSYEALVVGAALTHGHQTDGPGDGARLGVFAMDAGLFDRPQTGPQPSCSCPANWCSPARVCGPPLDPIPAVPLDRSTSYSALLFSCSKCRRPSVLSDMMGWDCRVTGCYDGDHYVDELPLTEATVLWREAGNRVQWKPAR